MAHGIGRRDFLRYGALSAVGPGAVAQSQLRRSAPAAVEEVSLEALRGALRDGSLTARAVTDACLARIDALDRQGPALRAVIEVNPEAGPLAAALDAARAAGEAGGPLHGIPILLKDNVGTADRTTTTAGSLALRGSVPAEDAFVARRLREAGRRADRQGEPERMGELPLDAVVERVECARRPVPQPLRPRSEPVRVELGVGGSRLPPASCRRRSAPRPTGRSSAPGPPTASSASSRPWVW